MNNAILENQGKMLFINNFLSEFTLNDYLEEEEIK